MSQARKKAPGECRPIAESLPEIATPAKAPRPVPSITTALLISVLVGLVAAMTAALCDYWAQQQRDEDHALALHYERCRAELLTDRPAESWPEYNRPGIRHGDFERIAWSRATWDFDAERWNNR